MPIMSLHDINRDPAEIMRLISLRRIESALDVLEPKTRRYTDIVRLPLYRGCLSIGYITDDDPIRQFTNNGSARLTVEQGAQGAEVLIDTVRDPSGVALRPPTIDFRDRSLSLDDHPAVQAGYDGFKVTVSPNEERLWGIIGNACIPVVPANAFEVEAFLSPCLGALENRSRT